MSNKNSDFAKAGCGTSIFILLFVALAIYFMINAAKPRNETPRPTPSVSVTNTR